MKIANMEFHPTLILKLFTDEMYCHLKQNRVIQFIASLILSKIAKFQIPF